MQSKQHNNEIQNNNENQITNYTLYDKFRAAVNVINALPEEGVIVPTIEERLKFYSLFKLATEDREKLLSIKKPRFWNIEDRLKWNSKKELLDSGMTKEDAMYKYIHGIGDYLKNIYTSGNADKYLDGADLSFLKKLTERDINILVSEIMSHSENESDIVLYFKKLSKEYAPKLGISLQQT
ncbi:hypothetical protein [Dasineura jujubifolia toursvirus 2a]|nr:hypothetical protein [Dasineura jujubifolia toursvirus 2a]